MIYFLQAGINIDERLAKVAVDAWAKWPNKSASAARRDYVASQLAGSLAWALWQQWDKQQIVMAIGKLLNDTRPKHRPSALGATPSVPPPPTPTQRPGTNAAKLAVTRMLSALDTVPVTAEGQAGKSRQTRRGKPVGNPSTAGKPVGNR